MNVTSILGSLGPMSRCAAMLRFARWQLRSVASELEEVVLSELPGDSLLQARFGDPAIREAIRQVVEADVVIVATPIHKASFSGLLKSFLDLLPAQALHGKTVLPLATGASEAHGAALDQALRPVLASLGAMDVLDTVAASDVDIVVQEFGGYRVGDEPRRRIEAALRTLRYRASQCRSAAELAAAREADAVLARVLASVHASSR
jgi:FMN reductase